MIDSEFICIHCHYKSEFPYWTCDITSLEGQNACTKDNWFNCYLNKESNDGQDNQRHKRCFH